MAIVLKRASRLPFAPVVAGFFAAAVGALVLAAPDWRLEQAVSSTGLASVLAAAAPPLGLKARLAVAVAAALLTGLVLWLALTPLAGRFEKSKKKKVKPAQPVADAASNAAPVADLSADPVKSGRRVPIFADRELGAPFMSAEALADSPIIVPPVETIDPDELVLEAPLMSDDELLVEEQLYTPLSEQPEQPEPAGHWPMSEPMSEPMPEPIAEIAEPSMSPAPVSPAPVSYAIPVMPPSDAHRGETIAELVERLEAGIVRRAAAISATNAAAEAAMAAHAVQEAASAPAAPRPFEPAPFAAAQKEVDSALRHALGTLEKLAAGNR